MLALDHLFLGIVGTGLIVFTENSIYLTTNMAALMASVLACIIACVMFCSDGNLFSFFWHYIAWDFFFYSYEHVILFKFKDDNTTGSY